jgi:hypothetical protein
LVATFISIHRDDKFPLGAKLCVVVVVFAGFRIGGWLDHLGPDSSKGIS